MNRKKAKARSKVRIKVFLVISLLLLITGCAREVTQLPTNIVKKLDITLTFATAPDISAGHAEIIVVFRDTAFPLSPYEAFPTQNFTLRNPQDIDDSNVLYWVEETVTDYFQNVFNTWDDCVVIQNGVGQILKGPFTSTDNIPITPVTIQNGTQIKFEVSVAQLSSKIQNISALDGRIYLNVFVIDQSNSYLMQDQFHENSDIYVDMFIGNIWSMDDKSDPIEMTPASGFNISSIYIEVK